MKFLPKLFTLMVFFISLNGFSQTFELRHDSKVKNLNCGGNIQIDRLIKQQLQLPDSILNQNKTWLVAFSFNLLHNGKMEDLKLLKGENKTAINEVERIIKKIEWEKSTNRSPKEPMEFYLTIEPKAYSKMVKKRKYQFITYPHLPIDSTENIFLFNMVQKRPEPIYPEGNYRSSDHFFNSKIRYPEAALRLGLKGQVEVEFVVEQNGMITNINVVKPLQGGCSEEAVRVIELLQWNPGIQNGKAVRVKQKAIMSFGSGN